MKLTQMRYKDYVWSHNPRVFEVSYTRQVSARKVPFGTAATTDMGTSCTVFSGEGEFAGQGAYEEFKKLAKVFYDAGPGILVHPVWQSANAHFVSLRLRQEPREDYVAYSFEFWERGADYSSALTKVASAGGSSSTPTAVTKTYTVAYGDTLSEIAARYSMTLSELLSLNPQISNPNLIYAGQVITVK